MEHRTQIDVLKRALKSKGITYKKLSQMLEMSEPTIRRMFSKGAFTLERYVKICRLIGLTYEEMLKLGEAVSTVYEFTYEQESFFASNFPYFIFLSNMLREKKSPSEMAREFNLDDGTLSKILAELDRLKILEWLPGNEVNLLISSKFTFLEDGPLRREWEKEGIMKFMEGSFIGENELKKFQLVRLSQESLEKLQSKMETLMEEFIGEMNREIILKKSGEDIGLLLATRPWNPYKEMLRNFKA